VLVVSIDAWRLNPSDTAVPEISENAIKVFGHWVVVNIKLGEMGISVTITIEPGIHISGFGFHLKRGPWLVPKVNVLLAPSLRIMSAKV
jgi:hypothetical protein